MTKFYKITNGNEIHGRMEYHDGLNIDVIPFNPSGNCEPGGIYFASKDILAFLVYGPWIREVTLPDGEPYYTNPGYPVKYKAHRVILGPRKQWCVPAVIQALLDDGCDPSTNNNYPIRWAALNGHLDIVKLLLADKRVDPTADDNFAIRCAADNGYIETVKLLLANPRVDPSDKDNYAIRCAAVNGYIEIVQLLKKYYEDHGLTIPESVL